MILTKTFYKDKNHKALHILPHLFGKQMKTLYRSESLTIQFWAGF